MKHKAIIHIVNGKIKGVHVSGETEVYIAHQGPGLDSIGEIVPDEFENGKAHEAFIGNAKQFLKRKKV